MPCEVRPAGPADIELLLRLTVGYLAVCFGYSIEAARRLYRAAGFVERESYLMTRKLR